MSDEAARNKAIIEAFFATHEAGGDVTTFLADDSLWWVPEGSVMGGTYRKDQLASAFERSFAIMDGRPAFTLNALTAEGDRVAVDCSGKGRFADGVPFHNDYHFLFVLKDGKIIKTKEFMDTALIAEGFASRLAKLKP